MNIHWKFIIELIECICRWSFRPLVLLVLWVFSWLFSEDNLLFWAEWTVCFSELSGQFVWQSLTYWPVAEEELMVQACDSGSGQLRKCNVPLKKYNVPAEHSIHEIKCSSGTLHYILQDNTTITKSWKCYICGLFKPSWNIYRGISIAKHQSYKDHCTMG